jgi:hypothetical protein
LALIPLKTWLNERNLLTFLIYQYDLRLLEIGWDGNLMSPHPLASPSLFFVYASPGMHTPKLTIIGSTWSRQIDVVGDIWDFLLKKDIYINFNLSHYLNALQYGKRYGIPKVNGFFGYWFMEEIDHGQPSEKRNPMPKLVCVVQECKGKL